MKTRHLITAAVLTLGMSATAQAAPKGLDLLLSRVVTQAISMTAEEVSNEVTESILNKVHHLDADTPKAKVIVTEIASVDTRNKSE